MQSLMPGSLTSVGLLKRCQEVSRGFSATACTACEGTPDIFDRDAKAAHRARMAFLSRRSPSHDALHTEAAERLVDRLRDVVKRFRRCLVLGGAGHPFLRTFLDDDCSRDVQHITYVDQAHELVTCVQTDLSGPCSSRSISLSGMVADEEFLPLASASHDLVVACNSLHWVNDLPVSLLTIQCGDRVAYSKQAFAECRRVLRPDGLLMGSVLGGDSLFELRSACHAAEEERFGGVSQRTSPLMHVRDAGNLLSGAQFSLQTVDTEEVTLRYGDAGQSIAHLRAVAEQSASAQGASALSRDSALAAAALYTHGVTSDDAGLESTFQLIHFAGWAPDPSQPRAAKRGSATASMKDIQTGVEASRTQRSTEKAGSEER